MNQPELNTTERGFLISGDIRFSNVLKIRQQANRVINMISLPDIEVDLSGVLSSDVSALSLLLRCLHYADQQGKKIRYKSIPEPLLKMMVVCGVDKLIGE